MKKSKLSESKIVEILAEGEAGVSMCDLCRKYKISSATYYKLRSKYAGMNVSELKRLKELESENRRLKSMYAEISMEHSILKYYAPKTPYYRLFASEDIPLATKQSLTNIYETPNPFVLRKNIEAKLKNIFKLINSQSR